MFSRFEAWLNEIPISSVSPDIYVRDIKYSAPMIRDTTHGYGASNGAIAARRYVDSITVTVEVEIHIYSVSARQKACEDLAAWACMGGWLKTNDKQDKRLNVLCQSVPTVASALSWTDAIPITFVAYSLPYWEDVRASTLTLEGRSASGEIFGAGYADRPYACVRVEVLSGTLTEIEMAIGNTHIELAGLSIDAGHILNIGYDDRHLMTIDSDGETLYTKRKPESSDDLRLEIGQKNLVTVKADTPVKMTVSARGLYW